MVNDCRKLDTLLPLPAGMLQLDFDKTPLRHLPSLPVGLQRLGCGQDTMLAIPPSIPSTLKFVSVPKHNWDSIPPLPTGLKYLYADNNKITNIPYLPDSLLQLTVGSNELTELNPLPHRLQWLWVSANHLTCLPALPITLTSLRMAPKHLSCMPRSVQGNICDSCSSIPYCDANSSCQYGGFQGTFYLDMNNNCTADSTEHAISAGFSITDTVNDPFNTVVVGTDSLGRFRFDLPTGHYRIESESLWPLTFPLSCPYFDVVDITSDTSRVTENFGYAYTGGGIGNYLRVEVATSTQRMCKTDNAYYLYYINYSNDTVFNASLKVSLPSIIVPLSFSTPFTSHSGNDYFFQLDTLLPMHYGQLIIMDSVSCNAVLGQSVCVQANIYPLPDSLPHGNTWDFSNL